MFDKAQAWVTAPDLSQSRRRSSSGSLRSGRGPLEGDQRRRGPQAGTNGPSEGQDIALTRPLIRYGSFALSVCHFWRPKRILQVRLDSHFSWPSPEVSEVSMINRGEGILAGHNIAFEDSRSRYLQATYKSRLISQEEELASRQSCDHQDRSSVFRLTAVRADRPLPPTKPPDSDSAV